MTTMQNGYGPAGGEIRPGAPGDPDAAPAWREADRLAALRGYAILDTSPEQAFDAITRLAADICEAPIALVSLVAEGRQWFKAEIGLGRRETPIDVSFCAHAILQRGLAVVPDAAKDSRFASNPLVTGPPHVRFYAGAPLEGAEGLPLGTLCVLDHRPRELSERQLFALEALARQVVSQLELRRALALQRRDAEALRASEEHQKLLTAELNHRIKNTLAMVQSIANQTLRNAASLEDARNAFGARLLALAHAHDVLTQSSWAAAPIATVVEGALAPHQPWGADRIRASGPEIQLGAKPAMALALALHELATNAAKYGALSVEAGHVDLVWRTGPGAEGCRFGLTWSEHGGPPVVRPAQKGFGTRLIERGLAGEFGGTVALAFEPGGVVCTIEAPLKGVAAE